MANLANFQIYSGIPGEITETDFTGSSSIVSLDEVKANAGVDFTEHDSLLQTYIDAAVGLVSGYRGILNTWLRHTTITENFTYPESVKDKLILLPCNNPRNALFVKFYGENDRDYQTISTGFQIFKSRGLAYARITVEPEPKPHPDQLYPLEISYTAGYPTTAEIPNPIRLAVILLVTDWYVQKTGIGSIPDAVQRLLAPFQRKHYAE